MRSVTKLKDTVTVVCYVAGHFLSISSKILGHLSFDKSLADSKINKIR